MSGSDSHKTGAVAELAAQMWYIKQGYEIYTPIMPQSKCDFIATRDKEVTKVQVKKATENRTKEWVYLQVRLQGKPTPYGTREYTKDDFDDLFIVHDSGMWKIPFEEVEDKKSLTFGRLHEDGSVTTGSRATVKSEQYKVN